MNEYERPRYFVFVTKVMFEIFKNEGFDMTDFVIVEILPPTAPKPKDEE